MSRSKKKSKSPGYEYWSKRPGNKKNNNPGKDAKKLNSRMERIEAKKIIKKEKEDV